MKKFILVSMILGIVLTSCKQEEVKPSTSLYKKNSSATIYNVVVDIVAPPTKSVTLQNTFVGTGDVYKEFLGAGDTLRLTSVEIKEDTTMYCSIKYYYYGDSYEDRIVDTFTIKVPYDIEIDRFHYIHNLK